MIFNLAWRRLKPWRRILSQSLAPTVLPGALQRIDAIELHHGPHALPLAWLLLGWLASRLDWRPKKGVAKSGNQLIWQFESPAGRSESTCIAVTRGHRTLIGCGSAGEAAMVSQPFGI